MKKILCFLLTVCMILGLAACGGAAAPSGASSPAEASSADAASSAEVPAHETVGDVIPYEENRQYGYGEILFVYVFEKDGVYYRATAEMPADVSEALWAIDYFDEEREQKIWDLVTPLAIGNFENLSERIPAQPELDARAGKTGQELLDDGWSIWSWNLDSMEFGMHHGPFAFTVVFEGTVEDPESFEEEQTAAFTVKSVAYEGLGDATSEVLDTEYAE